VLVVACPHALGLAIPLVIAISTTLAARQGILVRDRLALEGARKLDTVIFDKTGTLTTGQHGLVALAAAVEGDSEHPIARAPTWRPPSIDGFTDIVARWMDALGSARCATRLALSRRPRWR